MADYARRGDSARDQRNMSEQIRRLRTRRPLRGAVLTETWMMEGDITTDRYFTPRLITIGQGDYPEFKQIIAFDGWLNTGGPVTVSWGSNTTTIASGHAISGGTNRLVLPTPFVIENGIYEGEFIQPSIDIAPASCRNLGLMAIIETVPV